MNTYRLAWIPFLIVAILPVSHANGASTHSDNDQSVVQVREIDFSGAPPFRRSVVELPAASIARLETAEQQAVVRSVDFSGRPRFDRNVEVLRIIDVNRLEAGDAPARKAMVPFRGRSVR